MRHLELNAVAWGWLTVRFMDAVGTVLCPGCGPVAAGNDNIVVLAEDLGESTSYRLAFRCPACLARRTQPVSHSAARYALDHGCESVRVFRAPGPGSIRASEVESFMAGLDDLTWL